MERKLSTLELTLRQRPYVKSPSATLQSERNYLDFVIHGEHLKRLGPFEFDLEDYKGKLIRGLDVLKAPL